ncbi:MAG: nucleotide sugar dehydrogenase [Spirochaetes bacterium]|nr:nucleotide sugar dehydrogenase [Spirochaetota bacterium]
MKNLTDNLLKQNVKLAVIGLGYVGLPLAVAFSKKLDVVGFDINEEKIALYKKGKDVTNEIGDDELAMARLHFTSHPEKLRDALFHVVAVPTPVGKNNIPDLKPVESASRVVGKNLQKGSIVVYESTVYPGITEELCLPILETESGLRCGTDFKVGYSPERINPGDKIHTLENIVKVVAGMDEETLNAMATVYGLIIKAGLHRASSIRVAEAAKVIENAQRDINIAFMNELSIIFNKIGISTRDVLEAAETKWNFLKFSPGLVGGHCIGVDPYYLTYKAEEVGYHPQVILAGRRINDGMGKYVAENTVKMLIKANRPIKEGRVLVMGITFKENVPDIRNSKVIDVIRELEEYGIDVLVVDPLANPDEVRHEYRVELSDISTIRDIDAIVLAVAHEEYLSFDIDMMKSLFRDQNPILVDIKSIMDRCRIESKGFLYWSL